MRCRSPITSIGKNTRLDTPTLKLKVAFHLKYRHTPLKYATVVFLFQMVGSKIDSLEPKNVVAPRIPAIGDSDLRHACERALTSILASVSMIPPAGEDGGPPGVEECGVNAWLAGNQPLTLLDPDKLSMLASLIDQLLPTLPYRIASAS